VAHVVELLPSKHEALTPISSTEKKKGQLPSVLSEVCPLLFQTQNPVHTTAALGSCFLLAHGKGNQGTSSFSHLTSH
jgi:hypothetical protein